MKKFAGFLVLIVVLTNNEAVKIPVEEKGEDATEIISVNNEEKNTFNPLFIPSQNEQKDSYLPLEDTDVQQHSESPTSGQAQPVPAPSLYLLPPLLDSVAEFKVPTEELKKEEAKWSPMVQSLPRLKTDFVFNPNFQSQEALQNDTDTEGVMEASQEGPQRFPILLPSRQLLPPLPNTPRSDVFAPKLASQLQPPIFEAVQEFRDPTRVKVHMIAPPYPTISLDLRPPKPIQIRNKYPTKIFPKKYNKATAFKPIPIPIREFSDGKIYEIPKAKPVKPFKPVEEDVYELSPDDEKTIFKQQEAEEKRKFREQEENKKRQELLDSTVAEAFASPEQQTSETAGYHGARDSYTAPLYEAGAAQLVAAPQEVPGPAERTEFRMHGLEGPHSYKFGYDTGKGKNRQFRYEHRDNDGYVKGHYGYVDRHGKLQVVNYDAHPERGFHAEGPFGKA